jgi:hypothetical protein
MPKSGLIGLKINENETFAKVLVAKGYRRNKEK